MKLSSLAILLLAAGLQTPGYADITCVIAPVKSAYNLPVGRSGMTLYVFDKDVAGSGKSVCNGPCADNWPPYLAMAGDTACGEYTIIKRDDGQRQWALNGKPLYYWSKDMKPGDKTGDGKFDVWHVAKP